MSYSDINDLLKEFSEFELAVLTGDPTGVTINEDRVLYAEKFADCIIDSHLRGRYTLPFALADVVLRKIAVDLAVAFLFEIAYVRTAVPSTVLRRKKEAMQLLKDVQTGNLQLNYHTASASAPPYVESIRTNVDREFPDSMLNKINEDFV
jgi:phage gp36-like protein